MRRTVEASGIKPALPEPPQEATPTAPPPPVQAPPAAPAPAGAGQAAASVPAPAPGLVAKIGARGVITEQDLTDFSAAEGCYGSDAINSRKAGFMRMLEAAVTEEVLEREAGIALSPDDYQKELDRIDRETRAPEVLDCIKKYFLFEKGAGFRGDGRRRYERVYLRKHVLSPLSSKFIKTDKRVQGEVFEIRDKVLEKAGKGAAFTDLAREFGLDYSTHTYTLEEPAGGNEKGSEPPRPDRRWSPFEKQFIEENLKNLAPGQMKPEPVDSQNFQFVRLLSNADGKYYFESMILKRKTMEQYYASLRKLPSKIYDDELKAWLLGMPDHPMVRILGFSLE
ncbi:MAG: hypothetical protein A2X28_08715 [Elusimicrobia bacterium GWA2_56_46]|nr:MAG: hypothetical protein A2X28_08715 [Elusimicrobia bacterium GWA2_56_46]OGR55216.1 MAG: hypothetical protein A2X39_01620 [Elusimicrobia bacterium GWC2_56_31]HBW23709.1 hypothetical protein [Elusimicrobiota bacterium]